MGSKLKIVALGLAGSALLSTLPAFAQSATVTPAAPQATTLPAASSVAAFYDQWQTQPIWFRGGVENPAVAQLVTILQRAPFDGFAEGPQLAAQVQAAAAQAKSGTAADRASAERLLSTAWVQYVQALKRPTPGMTYVFPVLEPQGARADQILLTAAAAPSLEAHLVATANVNSLYAQMRDAAWAEAQASGNLTPDPRLIANLDRIRSIPAGGKFIVPIPTVSIIDMGAMSVAVSTVHAWFASTIRSTPSPSAARSAPTLATSRSLPKPTFSLNARKPSLRRVAAMSAGRSGLRPLA